MIEIRNRETSLPRFYIRLLLFLVTGLLLQAEQPIQADAFVDSIGVVTHLSRGPLYETDFDTVVKRLSELGVRHVRAGLVLSKNPVYYQNLAKLAKAGIHVLLLTDPGIDPKVVIAYIERVPGLVEAVEAPNEYDNQHKANWAESLQTYLPGLYSALKNDPSTASLTVVGPALTSPASFAKLGDQSKYFDVANMHNYPAGREPGTRGWGGPNARGDRYGSIRWNLFLGHDYWGNKPVWATEYGYVNDPAWEAAVPEEVAALYLPRALAEQYLSGVQRTYIFELISANAKGDDGFALMHTDGSVKPAFTAIAGLTGTLSDKGPAFQPSPLNISFSGDLRNVHHLLLQKRNGTYYLLMWIEASGYDLGKRQRTPVPERNVTVRLGVQPASIGALQLQENGSYKGIKVESSSSPDITISDKLVILQLDIPGKRG